MEIWKSVKGYDGIYEVSNFGRVKSLDRYIVRNDGITQLRKGKIIAQSLNSDGYCQLKLCKDGNTKTVRVHRIVAEAFIPNPNELSDVNHIDCNRTNNHVDNLEWLSWEDNVKHSANKGNYKRYGERNSNYGNTTLKEFYKNNPEEKKKLARKGSQNGRCRKVKLFDLNKDLIKEFEYIGECVEYLINENNLSTNTKSLSNVIANRCKKGVKKPYLGKYYFEIA